jgi:hypothetical protein
MKPLPLKFPIVVLRPARRAPVQDKKEYVDWFFCEESFSYIESADRKRQSYKDFFITDVTGKNWSIDSVKDRTLLDTIYRLLSLYHRVRYELIETPSAPFEDINNRVCNSIQLNREDWRHQDEINGYSNPKIAEYLLI